MTGLALRLTDRLHYWPDGELFVYGGETLTVGQYERAARAFAEGAPCNDPRFAGLSLNLLRAVCEVSAWTRRGDEQEGR